MPTLRAVIEESGIFNKLTRTVTCEECREEFEAWGVRTPDGVITSPLCEQCSDKRDIPPPCDKCGGALSAMWSIDRSEVEGYACSRCSAEWKRYLLRLHTDMVRARYAALCPVVYRETDVERLPFPQVVNDLRSWNRKGQGGRGLLLHGGSGKGKTRVAWLMVWRYLWHKKKVMAFSGTEFVTECSLRFADSATGTAWLNSVIAADLLFVDDIAKASFTEHRRAVLFEVVEKRIAAGRATIITLNEGAEEFAERLGDEHTARALLRRFHEFFTVVNFYSNRYEITGGTDG